MPKTLVDKGSVSVGDTGTAFSAGFGQASPDVGGGKGRATGGGHEVLGGFAEREEEVMRHWKTLLYSVETSARKEVSQVVVFRSHTNRPQGDVLQKTEPEDLAEQGLSD